MVQTTTERLTSLHDVYTADEEILTTAEIKVLKEKELVAEKARQEEEEEEEEEAEEEAEEEVEEEEEEAEVPPALHAPEEETQVLLLESTTAEQTQQLEATTYSTFLQGIDTAIDIANSAEELETMPSDVKAKADAAAAAGSEAGRAGSNNPDQAWALRAHVETQKRVAEREQLAKAGEKEATPGNDEDENDEAATQETQEKAAALGQAEQAEQAEDAAEKAKTGKAAAKAAPSKAATADGILTRSARTPKEDDKKSKRNPAATTTEPTLSQEAQD
ncbi:hypothetical protein CYMTET_3759 [Cymbomonas tetramitiformis]|uniref:Uncharacterized protein n=1 Tax=Cymbomonas tetramitiformis TaxID=36881 RepID=A0AAE0LL15_9CHLO|nr:hypothetical protein CYMTET_3759 [Cymbomonas tetramitiformis]